MKEQVNDWNDNSLHIEISWCLAEHVKPLVVDLRKTLQVAEVLPNRIVLPSTDYDN